jgi:hypothetical protein
VGVRIDANGKTAPLTASASLSSSANNYILSTTSVSLINALGAGIGSFVQGVTPSGQTNTGSFLVFTNQTGATAADSTASLVITEGFASAWRNATQESTSGVALANGTDIRLTFTGIPSGMTITITPNSGNAGGNRPSVLVNGASSGTVTAASTGSPTANQAILSFGCSGAGCTSVAPNLTAVDNLGLQLTISGAPSGTLSAGTFTVVATHRPIGDALDAAGVPTETGGFPRFLQADTAAVTFGTIAQATTTLLIPYALSGFGNYNTGIAVANTTADPFGTSGGGAVATGGTLTFTFYPNAGTGLGTGVGYSTTTAGRPGSGVDSSGSIAAGSTYAVLLSDLLTAAGRTGDFQGYAFISANFLNAHGVAYIFQGPTLTSAVPILVLPPPVSNGRSGGADGVEDLNN